MTPVENHGSGAAPKRAAEGLRSCSRPHSSARYRESRPTRPIHTKTIGDSFSGTVLDPEDTKVSENKPSFLRK